MTSRDSERSVSELSAVQALLAIVEGEGVEYVFCVPGGPLTGFFEALQTHKTIRPVLTKHEGGAAFMAASYARTRGGLAVCCATSGPGATNALTGIASAYADSLPVLLLTGQVATHAFGRGAIQESTVHGVDLVQVFRPVTKLSTMLASVARTPDIVRMAIRTAMSGRQGPVHLSLPADILSRPVHYAPIEPHRYRPMAQSTDCAAIAKAIALLAGAKRPCILAGHGVALARASEALLEVARRMGVPVATSPKGKGVFPENDPLSLGVLGFGGHALAEKYVESDELDVLVVVGSSMNEWVTNAWTMHIQPTTALVQIDVDPEVIGKNYPVDVGIVGDARVSLQELLAQTRNLPDSRRSQHAADALHVFRSTTARSEPPPSQEDGLLKPQHAIFEMREAMPDNAMLFVEAAHRTPVGARTG